MSPEEKNARLAQVEALVESMAPFFTPIPFRKPRRKMKVRCVSCGETISYTLSRLKKGICRSCNAPLDGIDNMVAMVNFRLEGKDIH
jgi:hypothetical protein